MLPSLANYHVSLFHEIAASGFSANFTIHLISAVVTSAGGNNLDANILNEKARRFETIANRKTQVLRFVFRKNETDLLSQLNSHRSYAWLRAMSAWICPTNSLPFNLRNVTAFLQGRLERNEAKLRARMLLEDVPRLRGPLRLRWTTCEQETWPYYTFDNNSFSEIPRSTSIADCAAIGYGLTWGDLVTLSGVIKTARNLWGEHWVRWFRERMAHFNNHLSTVEEIWWLGLWDSPSHIERECAPVVNLRTVDWQFESQGYVINLEIKYRTHEWLRFVNPCLYSKSLSTYFDGIAEKFRRKIPGQLNLVAMTLLGSLGPELRERAVKFLEESPTIDGILFWSIADRNSLKCDGVLRPECEFVHSLLREADEEHRWRNPFVTPIGWQFVNQPADSISGFNPLHGIFFERKECGKRTMNVMKPVRETNSPLSFG